jgi:hypothetical protein
LYGVLVRHKDAIININNKAYRDNMKYDLRSLEEIAKYIFDNRRFCLRVHGLARNANCIPRNKGTFMCNGINELSYATRMKSRATSPKPQVAAPTVSVLTDGVAPPKEQLIKNEIKFNWKNKSYYVTHKKTVGGAYTWVFHTDKNLTKGQDVTTLESDWIDQLKTEVKRQSSGLRATAPKSRGGWLGVNIQDINLENYGGLGLTKPLGALVTNIGPTSPAFVGGIKVEDVILEFNRKSVKNAGDLVKIVAATEINKKGLVMVFRNREKMFTQVSLVKRQ